MEDRECMFSGVEPALLRERVRAVVPEMIALRHRLHRHPEPGFEEHETSRMIRECVAGTRLRLLPPFLGTDVVGDLSGKGNGPCVLLRADMDALPMQDASGADYASLRPGWTHACGHDGHTAMLLGALLVLDGLTDHFNGHVRFVFQPAEEQLGGGRELVHRGVLDVQPVPRAAFALHGWPGIATGMIAARSGAMMAAQDRFEIVLRGRGGHAAQPDQTVDPVVLAAQVILALQTIVARQVAPVDAAVVSVCTVQAGVATNIIPEVVRLGGTIRHFDADVRNRVIAAMDRIVQHQAAAAGGEGTLTIEPGYVALSNDAHMTALAERVVRRTLGADAWQTLDAPSMGAEDFAYYLERVPGAMLRLGVGDSQVSLHHPAYDFADDAMENGILALVALALETLQDLEGCKP